MEDRSAFNIVIMTNCMLLIFMLFTFYVANASDPSLLQDFCVGINNTDSAVFINGMFCKNPKNVTVKDFVFKGFDAIGDTNNTLNAKATLIDVEIFPALNTLGVSISHIDYGPYGLNTPHHHPRSSEVFTVLNGTLYAGFVTTDYELFSVILKQGDMFVFPQGLIHFQYNMKKTKARAIAAFGSQKPGRLNTAQALFGTTPSIMVDVLTKAYQVDEDIIEDLQSQFLTSLRAVISAERSDLRLFQDE